MFSVQKEADPSFNSEGLFIIFVTDCFATKNVIFH